MFDIKKLSCDYFVIFPCECKKHYEFVSFTDPDKFIRFIEDACTTLRTETITEKFPVIAGVTKGEPLDNYYVYKFSSTDPKEKPIKVKWIGEGSIHALFKEGEEKPSIYCVVKKELSIVKSKDVEKVHGMCVEQIRSQRE